jgi:hypothetical protein
LYRQDAVATNNIPHFITLPEHPHAMKIFRMQKRVVRIMMGYKNRVSCRNLFRKLEILPFVSQYILLCFL